MSKVTVVSRPNRITIASKGVQGPPGDATPELLEARDTAVQAAIDAAGHADSAQDASDEALGAASAASGSASAAAASANLAEQARLLGATIGFSTKADMGASLAHPDGTLALVTNDPTPANNGTYRKTGASGSGSWVKSADRVSALEGQVAATDLKAGVEGKIVATQGSINLDLAAGMLRITSTSRVFFGRSSFLIPVQDVALPSTRQRVIANITTGEVSFTSANTTPATHVVLGSYNHNNSDRRLVGFPPHLVNGQAYYSAAMGRATAASNNRISFDLDARQLVISGIRINTHESSWSGVEATVPFPANSTQPYRLTFNPAATPTVAFTSPALSIGDGTITFGWVRIQPNTVDVYGIDQYEVPGGSGAPLEIYEGVLVSSVNPQFLDFDWVNGYLRVTASDQVRCLYGRSAPFVPAQDVAIPTGSAWKKILYDTVSRDLSFIDVTNLAQPPSTVVVGLVRPHTRTVYGVPDYYENGQPRASGGIELSSLEWLPVDGPTEPRFTLPALLSDFKAFGEFTNQDHNTVYALYDALVAAYPDYVTRTALGQDDVGKTIYRYDFLPPADSGRPEPGRLAKMILISGVHGYERAGVYCLYSALNQVCSRWQDDELLDTLRWNCHFIVVPVAVPDGFDRVDRLNPNGVDIARNFTANWNLGGAQLNPGPAPLSEKETQYLDAIMSANRDALYCGSFHNFLDSGSGDPTFIWNASATWFGIRLAQRLIARMSRKWKPVYPWLPQNNTSLFGYSNFDAPAGSEGKQSTLAYGIQGGTFEVSRALLAAPDPDSYSQYVNTLGTETVVNWLLMNLEHGAALYNGRGG